MSEYKQNIGQKGQELAKKYLLSKEYDILAEHYYIKGGEIDIIAKISQRIVFVEVKTRTSLKYGLPEDAVDDFKLKAMQRSAEMYLREKGLLNEVEISFDIIGILVNNDLHTVQIRHLQDIDIGHVFNDNLDNF